MLKTPKHTIYNRHADLIFQRFHVWTLARLKRLTLGGDRRSLRSIAKLCPVGWIIVIRQLAIFSKNYDRDALQRTLLCSWQPPQITFSPTVTSVLLQLSAFSWKLAKNILRNCKEQLTLPTVSFHWAYLCHLANHLHPPQNQIRTLRLMSH